MQFLQQRTLQSFRDLLLGRVYARLREESPQIRVFDLQAELFVRVHFYPSEFTCGASSRGNVHAIMGRMSAQAFDPATLSY
jgi:hypothetical protein